MNWHRDRERATGRLVSHSTGRPSRSLVGLGVGLAGVALMAGRGLAQYLPGRELRLTIRPRALATGTRTERAGFVDVKDAGQLYVPEQCVGTRRCPLFFYSNISFEQVIPMADRYGLITTFIEIPDRIPDDELAAALHDSAAAERVHAQLKGYAPRLDQRLQAILQTFAIDPDKIAIAGGSATGWGTSEYAVENMDVFSRMMVYTVHPGRPPKKAPTQTNEFYVSTGILEDIGLKVAPLVQQARDQGYPVKFTIQFRRHGTYAEDLDFMGRWLTESWAVPDPTARPAPYVMAEPPLLTAEALAAMTAFWTRFQQEPELIRTIDRRAHVREVIIPVGTEHMTTLMVDMPALASIYPSVAAALKAVGLTPEQHDAYRAALVSAKVTWSDTHEFESDNDDPMGLTGRVVKTELPKYIAPTSTVAKNLAFMEAHPEEFEALAATQMWETP